MSVNRFEIAISVNGVPIRLTDERWEHIIDGHADLANYRDDVLDIGFTHRLKIRMASEFLNPNPWAVYEVNC